MAFVNIYLHSPEDSSDGVISKIRDLRNKNIRFWIHRPTAQSYAYAPLIKHWKDIKYVEDSHSIETDVQYYEWVDRNVIELFCGLKWVISRTDQDKFYVFSNNLRRKKTLILFRDAIHKDNLPDQFFKIECFNNFDDFIEICRRNGLFDFSLDDTNRFVKASGISPIQGANVYVEIKTKLYWYLDMMHKTHYEIFDSTGKKHIGEADLDGNIDSHKADKSKKAIL